MAEGTDSKRRPLTEVGDWGKDIGIRDSLFSRSEVVDAASQGWRATFCDIGNYMTILNGTWTMQPPYEM
jgi:hypothetical protein